MTIKSTTQSLPHLPGARAREWDAPSVQWDGRAQSVSHCCHFPWWSSQCSTGQQPGTEETRVNSTELLTSKQSCFLSKQDTGGLWVHSLFHIHWVVYLNGCGGTGQGDECACSLILHGRTGGLQQVVDATDEPGALWGVSVTHLAKGKQKREKTQNGVNPTRHSSLHYFSI